MQHVAFDEPIRASEQYRPILDGQFIDDGLTWAHDYTLRMERVAGRPRS